MTLSELPLRQSRLSTPTISHSIDTVYSRPPRAVDAWHFSHNLENQQRALGEGLCRAVGLASDELLSYTANGRPPQLDHMLRTDLYRMRKSLATISLGTAMFKEFLDSSEITRPPQEAFKHLQSAITATSNREFGNAYMDAAQELSEATVLKNVPLVLDGGVLSHMVGESLRPYIDSSDEYTPPTYNGSVLLPFAVIAASAALPNNPRLYAAAGTAIGMTDVASSLHSDPKLTRENISLPSQWPKIA